MIPPSSLNISGYRDPMKCHRQSDRIRFQKIGWWYHKLSIDSHKARVNMKIKQTKKNRRDGA